MKKEIIKAEKELQARMDKLLLDGAECRIMDGKEFVTSLYLASFEVLKAVPYFSRSTGKVLRFAYWCWFQELHFEGGMNRSHLTQVKQFDWINNRNLPILTNDYKIIISAINPPEVDPYANAAFKEWEVFQRANPWMVEITDRQREEFTEMVGRLVT